MWGGVVVFLPLLAKVVLGVLYHFLNWVPGQVGFFTLKLGKVDVYYLAGR